ncbi:hypothetical protein HDU96_001964 [Phlyctochytrium bullatum]|nr:hypothetical protein HDU96_001964 [Phlyctochytrium bullatum]
MAAAAAGLSPTLASLLGHGVTALPAAEVARVKRDALELLRFDTAVGVPEYSAWLATLRQLLHASGGAQSQRQGQGVVVYAGAAAAGAPVVVVGGQQQQAQGVYYYYMVQPAAAQAAQAQRAM